MNMAYGEGNSVTIQLDPSHVESKVKHERNTHRFAVHRLDIQYTKKKQVLYIIYDLSYVLVY